MITVALDMLAPGLIIPHAAEAARRFPPGDAAHGAEILGPFGTVWTLMQFLSGPVGLADEA